MLYGGSMKQQDFLPDRIKAAADYTLATGIDCWYIPLTSETNSVPTQSDVHAEKLFRNSSDGQPSCCTFCSAVEKSCGIVNTCLETHKYAAYQAERFGGKYLYFCRMSLLHWASPIIEDGMLAGALVGGPVMIFEADDLYLEECRRKYQLDIPRMQAVLESLDSVPEVSTERANSLADMLFLVAMSLSDNDAGTFFSDRIAFEQESRIGEYLHMLKSMEGDKRSDMEYPLEKEKQLMHFVAVGSKREAEKLLEEILGTVLYATGVRLDLVKSRILELAVLLSRAAVEGGADVEQIFGLNYHYLTRIRELETLAELTQWLGRIMNRFVDLVFDLRSVRHTQKIIQAIRLAAGQFREKLTLADVAEMVQLSPSYFSRLFKQEMGTSFSEYLADLRLGEAKKLLLSTSQNMGEIGFACGFEDQSYFTKVFKKKFGITPNRYRETGGRYVQPDPAIRSGKS